MKNIKAIVEQLTNTSSTNDKITILRSNKDNELLKKVIEYTYNPNKKYGISEKVLDSITKVERRGSCDKNIFELLDVLASNNINDLLRIEISKFATNNKDMWPLYRMIILKDLRCNISSKTIAKVWKGLIPEHKVMLASKFEGEIKGKVAVTTKMDGIRISAIVENGKVKWLTRQGKEVLGLNELTEQILNITNGNLFIDGEILALNPGGLNSDDLFRKTTKIVNSKETNKVGLRFVTFDVCDLEDYYSSENNVTYTERRLCLEELICSNKQSLIDIVKLHTVTDDVNEIRILLDEVISEGSEGLMLNYIDKPYDFKRSRGILKCKKFHTVDLRVLDVVEGTGKHKGKLGSVVVDYKGYRLNVGSGFADDEREYIWNNPGDIIGKIIEVSYFEESKNEQGGLSLRFPIFKSIRFDKNEVSYN